MQRQPQLPLSVGRAELRGRLGVLLIGVALISGCVGQPPRFDAAPRETALAADRVALPASFTNGLPYVDLRVNGHGPYRFLVDTGAEGTSISVPVAEEIGLAVSRKYRALITGSSGHATDFSIGKVARLEAPGFVLRNVVVAILPPQNATALDPLAGMFGGIVGMSAFREVRLEIDYPDKRIRVLRLDTEAPPTGTGIPYTGTQPHVTIATTSSLHATTTALIDTGSDSGIELADIADYPLRVGLAKVDGYHHGIGGFRRPLFGQMAGEIRLGSAIWSDPMIHSSHENRIGSEALDAWKVVIDQEKKLLWLLEENQINTTTWSGPLEPDGRPSVYGFAFLMDGDSFVVREVDPGSRAERAGLKAGDRFVTGGDEENARDPLRDHPYVVRLHVVRGGEKLEITLSLSQPLPASAEARP